MMMSSDVLAADGKTTIRREANEVVRHRIEAMSLARLKETAPGVAASLVCVDHSSMAYLEPFYGAEHRLRSEGDFRNLTSRLLDASIPEASRRRIGSDDVTVIGTTLRELFGNTHDHARTDTDGRPWRKSVRGVFVSHYQIEVDRLQISTQGLEPLYLYMSAHRKLVKQKHIQFFEISVYDSGPGFAARRLGKKVDPETPIQDEYEAVTSCFLKHVSSKGKPTDGLGLYRVMGLLKRRRGFLRLRTGRLSLFRSFAPESSEQPELSPADLTLRDVSTGVESPSIHAQAEGAAVSVILPVGRSARW
ncbi:hypothetical protein IVA86_00240 [Bradyrhizobium sp. 146]|uniref:hypothetical protein n=1 Tax=Bradyrhizobium sp. 146 TaxID=2782622 RepID=UPI001FFA6F2F|nr:hypothetical protein [Bradyrhizobium sp. 146]MCK1699907.1 hypothetical protein [Bradyrhizobium sp. 146]